jgi:hypothetical protein
MTAVNLTESAVYALLSLVQTNIQSALVAVSADRSDQSVATEPPKTFFAYAPVQGYRCPAVVIVADSIDFMLDRGQNSIDAQVKCLASVTVEDRTLELLQKKAWRYMDALYQVLNRAQVVSGNRKFISTITAARYSNDSVFKDDGTSQSVFRKEVVLDLTVENYQND